VKSPLDVPDDPPIAPAPAPAKQVKNASRAILLKDGAVPAGDAKTDKTDMDPMSRIPPGIEDYSRQMPTSAKAAAAWIRDQVQDTGTLKGGQFIGSDGNPVEPSRVLGASPQKKGSWTSKTQRHLTALYAWIILKVEGPMSGETKQPSKMSPEEAAKSRLAQQRSLIESEQKKDLEELFGHLDQPMEKGKE
jgi:hypothetical protein